MGEPGSSETVQEAPPGPGNENGEDKNSDASPETDEVLTHDPGANREVERTEEKTKTKKKKKKKSMNKNKKERLRLERWYKEVLEKTKEQVEGIPEEKLSEMPPEFEVYGFSGDLRPCYVTKQVTVPSEIEKPDYADDGIPVSENDPANRTGQIHVHTPEEIEIMRDVCRIGREVLDIGGKFLKAGATGDEIDRIIHAATIERGAYPSPLNYNNFPKSVCVSVNEVICHGIPDCRKIQEGDIVNLDVSVYKNGFHADLNETYIVGDVDEDAIRLVKTAYECLQQACEMIRPGTMYRDVGAVISRKAAQNGCAVVKTYCGHGVGRLFHTSPSVPHYSKNKAIGIMRPGHIFTIEPMINDGSSWSDALWPDNWTAVTTNGKRSAQFEHTFLVTETGVDILTARKGAPTSKLIWDENAIKR